MFRVHHCELLDFRRHSSAVSLSHFLLKWLKFYLYAITCSLKLAMLINQPWMSDVPENIEIHTTTEKFCGNAMENLTSNVQAPVKNYIKMMQVVFTFLKKSLSKIPTCSCRENYWSDNHKPEHRVPYIIELEESASRRDEMGSSLLTLLDLFRKHLSPSDSTEMLKSKVGWKLQQ